MESLTLISRSALPPLPPVSTADKQPTYQYQMKRRMVRWRATWHPTFSSGLPDFSSYNLPKREKLHKPNGHKMYQMAVKYTKWQQNVPNGRKITKWPQNIPNGHNIYQMAIKYTKMYHNFQFQGS
jgi:hypothetical protein